MNLFTVRVLVVIFEFTALPSQSKEAVSVFYDFSTEEDPKPEYVVDSPSV